MIYQESVTTPANTALAGLQKTSMKITNGLIYRVNFQFPSGCNGLAGVAVFDGLFQIWPSSAGNFFASDYETIAFDDLYLKEEPPFELQIYTYNLDDTYDHLINIRIGMVSNEAFIARFLPLRGYEYLNELIKITQQEKDRLTEEQRQLLEESPFQWLLRQEGIE